ncbi:two pore domain potassium channel family protein [Streptomyces sp. t39]|nr:two pore domain potassium channel family protein [Streptomyces sp. t39]
MTLAFFLVPLEQLGTRRPVLSWAVFVGLLVCVSLLLLVQIRDVITDDPRARPGIVIPLLVCVTVVAFAGAYHVLARHPGEFSGLTTRTDALYFTVVTLATVGYGDIVPTGQSARVVTMAQILYTFVFLTAATTTLSRRLRSRVGERLGVRIDGPDGPAAPGPGGPGPAAPGPDGPGGDRHGS